MTDFCFGNIIGVALLLAEAVAVAAEWSVDGGACRAFDDDARSEVAMWVLDDGLDGSLGSAFLTGLAS